MAENLAPTQSPVTVSGDPTLNRAVSALRRMRTFRRQYDQRRANFYRQYIGQRDQRTFPDNLTPRSNTFVPYPYSNVETTVSRVDDAFFGFDPWFETKPRGQQDDTPAEAMQHVLHDRLDKANFKAAFETLVRNICIYGHAGIKVDWDWDYDTVTYAEPIPAINPETGQPLMQAAMGPNGQLVPQPVIVGYRPATKQVPRCRPRFFPIDIYDLLIDPDGTMVAHLVERTLEELLREQANSVQQAQSDLSGAKQPLYNSQALEQLRAKVTAATPDNPGGVLIRIAELWDNSSQTQTVLTFGEDNEALSWKDLRISLRAGANYSSFRRKVYGGEAILLYSGPNPFAHKLPPILCTSFTKLPNEIFGLGCIETISDLTESLNKFVNMIADNWDMGINRRYAYDTAADIDHEALNNFNTPGGKVGVAGDPNKVIAPLPFFTPQAGDYQILDIYKNVIEMTSGISDFYGKGVGSPTGNKTGSGIAQTINESNFRFKLFIRNLEKDVLQPLLKMCASMCQQYMPSEIEIQITGDQQPAIPTFIQLSAEQLIGNFEFELVAANYASNKVVRQRSLLELTQMLAGSPYINQYESIKELAKVFEIRNINKLLYTPQQIQQQQQAQQAQQIEMMIFESMLQTESKARLGQSKPVPTGGGQGAGGGPKTYKVQPIHGAGLEGAIRTFAQKHGATGLGLDGLGVTSD